MNKKNRNINQKSKPQLKKAKKKARRFSTLAIMSFFIFEILFTACTFPFMLLYGPFKNAKSTYVGAAMTSMNHQYLAKCFLSDAKIAEILGQNSTETTNETTNTSQIQIPKVKDETIESYEMTDNPKYKGYYLVIKDSTRIKIGYTSKLNVEGETTSQIAINNDAIAAINGGGFTDKSSNQDWTGNGGFPIGLIMSGGKVVFNDLGANGESDLLAITKEGVMLVGNGYISNY